MTKKQLFAIASLALFLGACAGKKPVKDAAVDPEAAKAVATAKPGSPGPGDQSAPILVGPDIIAAVPADLAWKSVSDVENWGAWNSKVTAVQPGAGLNTGTELKWKWEEKEIRSTVVEVKDGETLWLKGCKTGSDVGLKWTIKALDAGHTVVSLRAVLKHNANQTLIANAGVETQAWLMALQDELNKKAAALPKPKKAKKAAK